VVVGAADRTFTAVVVGGAAVVLVVEGTVIGSVASVVGEVPAAVVITAACG